MLQTLFYLSWTYFCARVLSAAARCCELPEICRLHLSFYDTAWLGAWSDRGEREGCWPGPVSCALGIRGENFMRRAAAVAVVVLVL